MFGEYNSPVPDERSESYDQPVESMTPHLEPEHEDSPALRWCPTCRYSIAVHFDRKEA